MSYFFHSFFLPTHTHLSLSSSHSHFKQMHVKDTTSQFLSHGFFPGMFHFLCLGHTLCGYLEQDPYRSTCCLLLFVNRSVPESHFFNTLRTLSLSGVITFLPIAHKHLSASDMHTVSSSYTYIAITVLFLMCCVYAASYPQNMNTPVYMNKQILQNITMETEFRQTTEKQR